MVLCLHNRSSQPSLLKIDKVEEVVNVAENKTKSITDIFFLKYYLDLGLLRLYSREFFFWLNITKNKFLNTLNGWLRRKETSQDSDSLENNNSTQKKIIRNCHSEILWSTKVKLVKRLAVITFVISLLSRSKVMEHLKEISQKPKMCPFGADFL